MTNFVGRLGVTLGLDSAEFSRGIDSATNKLKQLGNFAKQYGAVAGTALVAATTAAAKYADELVDVAAANDVAISSVIQLRDALAKSGGEAGNASKLLSSFTQFIDKAATGSFEAQKTLKGLNVTLHDLQTLTIDQLFRKAAAGLAAMEDPLTRNAKGMEVFGKAFKGIDAQAFNDEVSKATKITKEHEEGIKAAAEAYDDLAELSRRAMEKMAAFVGPTLKKITQAIKDYEYEAKPRLAGPFVFIEAYIAYLEQLTQKLTGVQSAASSALAKMPDSGVQGGRGNIIPDLVGGSPLRTVKAGVDKEGEAAEKKRIEELIKRFKAGIEAQDQLADAQREMDEYNRKVQEQEIEFLNQRKQLRIEALRIQQNEIDEGERLIAEQSTEYQKANAALVERQKMDAENIERQKIMLDLADRGRYMKASEYQLLQETLSIQWKYADLTRDIRENESLTAEAREQALERLINLQTEELKIAQQRFNLAQKYQSGTFAEGFADAMKTSMMNAATAFQYGQQAFDSVMGNMESAISRFVQTGKLSFKDLAKSIISDLIAIQLKAQATALFSRMVGSMFGPSMAFNSATNFAATAPQGWLGFANGGDPPVNQPSIVGERGPELFVPKSAGTIVPNHQLAGMMGGGQTINYNGPFINQMSAIDTQSATQFLAQNKQAVWAANQSAQRSLPMSR